LRDDLQGNHSNLTLKDSLLSVWLIR